MDEIGNECEQLEKDIEELENKLKQMQGEADRRAKIEQELNDRLQLLQGNFKDKVDMKE